MLTLVSHCKVIANSVKKDGTISDIIGGTGVQDRWCLITIVFDNIYVRGTISTIVMMITMTIMMIILGQGGPVHPKQPGLFQRLPGSRSSP